MRTGQRWPDRGVREACQGGVGVSKEACARAEVGGPVLSLPVDIVT